jgi:hypothetical protein
VALRDRRSARKNQRGEPLVQAEVRGLLNEIHYGLETPRDPDVHGMREFR